MKANLIFIIVALFTTSIFYSCSENKYEAGILPGEWNYQSPYFVFQYGEDTVHLNMGMAGSIAMTPKDISNLFIYFAGEKMGDYFKGVRFRTHESMVIYMEMGNGVQDSLKATYRQNNELVGTTLDSGDLKRLTGMYIPIPEISFHYLVENNNMTLYLDKTYVQFLTGTMIDQVLDMILPSVIPNFDRIPEMAQKAMKASFKKQINEILENTKELEIGINLTSTKSL